MATKQSSSSKIMVPQARAAMNKFKMEAANEVGVDLKKGYNGSMIWPFCITMTRSQHW